MAKTEDAKTNDAPTAQASKDPKRQTSDAPSASVKTDGDDKSNGAQPLAPPPKPSQQSNPQSTPDYFGGHNKAHFSLEPNPFEQSFGNPAVDTPGKFSGLPSVANLTSPAPLGTGNTPNWQDSLRAGPLSPAMLQGPTNQANGYFDDSFRNNYPTPNESSLRTGLTPGGGGSMFPAPSPNTQAIFNLQGGGATPGTLEFQRTAMSAAARSKTENNGGTANANQNSQDYKPAQQTNPAGRQDPFGAPESEAVNSLYMLAQTGGRQNNNQFAVPNQTMAQQQRMQNQDQSQSQDNSPSNQRGADRTGASAGKAGMEGDDYDDSDEQKPTTRSRGKKGNTKAPAKKRQRGNNGAANTPEDDSDDGMSLKDEGGEQLNSNGKKMTDDEKRRNFLERNRIAALKCRQRKKQWLANLQAKVEIFTQENDALTAQCTQLREEIINLKTLLLAHKDCQVSHQQGLGGQAMAQFMGDVNQSSNPYGMGNGQQMMGMQGQGMQRS